MKKYLSFLISLVFISFSSMAFAMEGMGDSSMGGDSTESYSSSAGGFSLENMFSNVKYGASVEVVGSMLKVDAKDYDYGYGAQVNLAARMMYVEPYAYVGWLTASQKAAEDADEDDKKELLTLQAPYAGVGLKVNAGQFGMFSPYLTVNASYLLATFKDDLDDTDNTENKSFLVNAGAGVSVFLNDQMSVNAGYTNTFYSKGFGNDDDAAEVEYKGHEVRLGFSAYM